MFIKKILARLIGFSIVVFWILMMAILFTQEVVSKNFNTAYKPFFSKNTLLSDQWMGIYFQDALVGFAHTSLEPFLIKKGISGYRIANRTFMNFLLFKKRNKVWFDASALIDENYQLSSFDFILSSGVHKMSVAGEIINKKIMELKIESQGNLTQRKIILPSNKEVIMANFLSPFSSFGELKVGAQYSLRVFNPFSLELEPLEIKVAQKEIITYLNEPTEVFVVKSFYRGLEQTAWVNAKGEILKEETALGWVLMKEDANVANRVYKDTAKSDVELLELISLGSNANLVPGDLVYLKIALTGIEEGFDLESQRQKIVEQDMPKKRKIVELIKDKVDKTRLMTLPIDLFKEFQKESKFIQTQDPRIKALANKIKRKGKNSFQIAEKINQWVFGNIQKTPVVSIPSAIDVLNTREGDCNEHTVLFTALARAAGIPAKINVGLVYLDGRFYYHAWPSVFVGQWVDMDPTFGQDIADCAHLKLLEGDLNRQLDVVKLLGKIKLEVIDFK